MAEPSPAVAHGPRFKGVPSHDDDPPSPTPIRRERRATIHVRRKSQVTSERPGHHGAAGPDSLLETLMMGLESTHDLSTDTLNRLFWSNSSAGASSAAAAEPGDNSAAAMMNRRKSVRYSLSNGGGRTGGIKSLSSLTSGYQSARHRSMQGSISNPLGGTHNPSLKDGIGGLQTREAMHQLKGQIYERLQQPVARCFERFFHSDECDAFLADGVKYIQLFLRHRNAHLAAESKVGIDRLKRLYYEHMPSDSDFPKGTPPTLSFRPNGPPDPSCQPHTSPLAAGTTTASPNDSMSSSSGQQRSASPDPLNTSQSSTQAQAGSLTSSMTKPMSPNSSSTEPTLESLLTQRDSAMHDLCLKYCRIIQRFGASLTIAVERSFYECFYDLLSEYFRAHTTAGEWAVVGPHLESIFQAPRIRKSAVAHVLPDRRTGISSGATLGAVTGPVGGLAGRGPGGSPGAIGVGQGVGINPHAHFPDLVFPLDHSLPPTTGPSRRMSMAVDALGNKLLGGGKSGDDAGMGAATGARLAGIVSQALISNAAMAAAVVAAGAPSVNSRKNMGAIAALANSTNTGPTGSGQHEVMEVIARALERKKVEDAKQREREERRQSEAKVTARENFSLRSIIHARSPLVALIMPTARDQTAKVVQAGKQILVGHTKDRTARTRRQHGSHSDWHPSSELGPTSDAPPPPSAIRRAVTARAARSPPSAGKSSNTRSNSIHHHHAHRPSTSSATQAHKLAPTGADTPDPTVSTSPDPDPASSNGPRLSLPASSGTARRHSRAGSLGIPAILTSPSFDATQQFGSSSTGTSVPTRAGALHLAIATAEEASQLAALSLGDFVEAVRAEEGAGGAEVGG